jgi:hypothetical protein
MVESRLIHETEVPTVTVRFCGWKARFWMMTRTGTTLIVKVRLTGGRLVELISMVTLYFPGVRFLSAFNLIGIDIDWGLSVNETDVLFSTTEMPVGADALRAKVPLSPYPSLEISIEE